MSRIFIALVMCLVSNHTWAMKSDLHFSDRIYTLEIPNNYIEACKLSKEFRKMMSSSMPPATELLSCYVEKEEFLLFPDVDPEKNNYLVQFTALKNTSGEAVSAQKFAVIKQQFKQLQETLLQRYKNLIDEILSRASEAVSEITKEKIVGEIEGVKPLGVLSESDSHLSLLMSRTYKMQTPEGEIAVKDITVTNTMLLDGHIVQMLITKFYQDEGDVKDVKNAGKTWYKAIRESKVKVPPAAKQ